MSKSLILSSLMLVLTVFTNCKEDYFFEQKKSTANPNFWIYTDSIRFDFDLLDTSVTYNLMMDLTHSDGFIYENLYVKIHTIFPSGKQLGKLKSLQLIAPTGGWLGKKSGEAIESQFMLQDHTIFREPGHYSIIFEQFMRRDSLSDIQKIGLKIEKTSEKRSSKGRSN